MPWKSEVQSADELQADTQNACISVASVAGAPSHYACGLRKMFKCWSPKPLNIKGLWAGLTDPEYYSFVLIIYVYIYLFTYLSV